MIPHPGSGNPWRQNLSGSYGPGESGPFLLHYYFETLKAPERSSDRRARCARSGTNGEGEVRSLWKHDQRFYNKQFVAKNGNFS